MANTYLEQDDCKSRLGKHLQAFRADRPSEWLMDDFIREAEEMHERVLRLEKALRDISSISWGNDGDCGACAIADAAI